MSFSWRGVVALSMVLASLALGACSSSFGGGSSPPQTSTVVVPACANGSAPPCN